MELRRKTTCLLLEKILSFSRQIEMGEVPEELEDRAIGDVRIMETFKAAYESYKELPLRDPIRVYFGKRGGDFRAALNNIVQYINTS